MVLSFCASSGREERLRGKGGGLAPPFSISFVLLCKVQYYEQITSRSEESLGEEVPRGKGWREKLRGTGGERGKAQTSFPLFFFCILSVPNLYSGPQDRTLIVAEDRKRYTRPEKNVAAEFLLIDTNEGICLLST